MIGKRIFQIGPVDSTNGYLSRRVETKGELFHGDVFISNEQTDGKGLGENHWESEIGKNFTFSIYLLPDFMPAEEQFFLNMAISLGVHDFVLDKVSEKSVKLKWPNDIYIENKKVGGILISHSIGGSQILYTIAGIGININQTSFLSNAPNPASLRNFLSIDLDLDSCLNDLLKNIEYRFLQLRNKNNESIAFDYSNVLLGYMQWRTYIYKSRKIKAKIMGVSKYGVLQLIDENKEMFECDFKEIEFTF